MPLCLCESFFKLSFNELSREYSEAVQTGMFRVCGVHNKGKDRLSAHLSLTTTVRGKRVPLSVWTGNTRAILQDFARKGKELFHEKEKRIDFWIAGNGAGV